MMKKINLLITAILLFIFSLNLVAAMGVTFPHPQNIELTSEQSSYFSFQIQSDDSPLTCVPIIEDAQGLQLAFNQKYEIEPNEKFIVKPQIIVPKQTPLGSYKATFCIECTPHVEEVGSKIIPKICNLPITVNVVSERTRANIYEEKESRIGLWITLLIIAIVLLTLIIYFLVRKRK